MISRDLTGQKFGNLLCLNRAENIGLKTAWNCVCDCGAKVIVQTGKITLGKTISCGCSRYKREVLKVGLKIGEFTLQKKLPLGTNTNSGRLWEVICSCGKRLTVSTARLRLNKFPNCKSLVHYNSYRIYPQTPDPYPEAAASIVKKYLFLLQRLNYLDSEDIALEAIIRGAFISHWRAEQGFPIHKEKAYFLKIIRMAKIQSYLKNVKIKVQKSKGRLCQMKNNTKVVAQAETPPNFRLRKKLKFKSC